MFNRLSNYGDTIGTESITEGDLGEVWVSEGSYAVGSSGLHANGNGANNMLWFADLFGFIRCTNPEGGCVLDGNRERRILFMYPHEFVGTGTLDGTLTIRGFNIVNGYEPCCGGGIYAK